MATRAMPATGTNDRLAVASRTFLSLFDNVLIVAALITFYFWICTYLYTDIIANFAPLRQIGFEPYPANGFVQFAALGFCLFPLLWLRRQIYLPSDLVTFHLYLYVYVPTTAYIVMAAPMSFRQQLAFLTMTLFALALLEVRRVLRPVMVAKLPTKESWFIGILVFLSLAIVIAILVAGEVTMDSLDLDTVYERRGHITGGNRRDPLLYAANWGATAIAPLTMVYGLLKRQWWLVGIGLLLATACFAHTSFRSHLFTPIFAAVICMVLRPAGPKRAGAALLFVALALCLLPLLYDLVTGGLATWIVHFRFIGNNGFLSAHYFFFFAEAPKGLYQDTFGGLFFAQRYHLPIAELVGSSFSIAGNHANGNLWADGFGNMGVFGVAFASFSAVLLCWLVDSLSHGLNRIQVSSMLIPLTFVISNTSVHTAMTSNGGLLILMLLYIMPRSDP